MSRQTNSSIARRDFLKGSAAVVGTAALSSTGLAGELLRERASVQMVRWDGQRWASAPQSAAAPLMPSCRIAVWAGSDPGVFSSLTVHYPTADFCAWAAGGGAVQFEMPVPPDGVKLSVRLTDGRQEFLILSGSLEGVYAIAPSGVSMRAHTFEGPAAFGRILNSAGEDARFGYLLISVERV